MDEALRETGAGGRLEILAALLIHGRKPTRLAASAVIKAAGGEAAKPLANVIESGGYFSLQLSAREVAGTLKEIDPDPVKTLLDILGRGNLQTQQGVMLILRALGLSKAVKSLVEMLEDKRVRLRVFVVRSLGGISGKKATDGLILALQDRNRLVRMQALEELADRTKSADVRDAIEERQKDRSKHVRQLAREILAEK